MSTAHLKKNGSRLLDFFIEYGTVERLGERIEHCMAVLSPTQAAKTICAIAVAF